MTNVVAFPKPFKRPKRGFSSRRRVSVRARLEALLLELKIRAQHIADQYAMLHDAVAEFNERVEIECVATKSWTPPR